MFAALDRILSGRLSLIYSTLWTPPRVQRAVEVALGPRAIGLSGERRWGDDGESPFANSRVCIPYQPGLYRTIVATRPDLLIADAFFRWTPAAICYKMQHRKRLVICYERTCHTERNAQSYRTMYRRAAIRCTDAICCNGQLSARYARQLGMPSSRITTGHMAADVEFLSERVSNVPSAESAQLRQRLGVQGLCFLYVGRLIPRKGLRQLLGGWYHFQSARPGRATLVIVGEGSDETQLEQLVTQRRLRGVRFAGAVDYDNIATYYAAADALVMPTLEDNWSLVVPEAMACGLPIVCSRHNGCWPELVQEGKNGWVFDPLDTLSVQRVLTKACDCGEQLSVMGRRSRDIVAEHSPQHAAEAIWSACRIALNRKSGLGKPSIGAVHVATTNHGPLGVSHPTTTR